MDYAWFIWTLLLLAIWGLIYVFIKDKASRKEMLAVSGWTSLFGLTEPFFVPEYWNPPSLFNLAQTTGFDIESLLFSFGVGGIAVVLYDWIFKVKHQKMPDMEKHAARHRYHWLALSSGPLVFLILMLVTSINPIYAVFIALMAGGLATWYCRPDLKKKMIVSAFLFLIFYWVYFATLALVWPNFVDEVWNLSAISGIKIAGIPLEELIFAFSLGFFWSSVYEHIRWYKVKTTRSFLAR